MSRIRSLNSLCKSAASFVIMLAMVWSSNADQKLHADDRAGDGSIVDKPLNPRDTTRPLTERLDADQDKRILELIYVLRNYQVFSRDEEMAQAIYELHQIGSTAVPALIAELDRTDRDQTLRALGIAMRAMDDPRAVPALIHAVPKTFRPTGSDCGVAIRDRELQDFMLTLETHPDPDKTHMSVGRPVNEIHRALERLTGHSATDGQPDALRHVHFGNPEGREGRRKQFLDRRDHWQAWWNEHGTEFLPASELAALDKPTPPAMIDPETGLDEVDQAGIARFGTLFPTGPGSRLGMVHEAELLSLNYADAPCAIDFDQHRSLRFLEGLTEPKKNYSNWKISQGVDFVVGGSGNDLRVWVVDDELWDSIDEQIQNPDSLPTGEVPRGGLSRVKGPATLLFTTREGSSGIMQIEPYQNETASRKVRYRVWLNEFTSDETPTVENLTASDREWGERVYVNLQGPGPEATFALSIDSGKRIAFPEGISIEEFKKQLRSHDQPGPLNEWKVANSADFLTTVTSSETEGAGVVMGLNLCLLDSVTSQVRPESFQQMSVDMAARLLSEGSAGEPLTTKIFYSNQLPGRATYLFRTHNDQIGILQVFESSLQDNVVKFRYKLAKDPDQD